MDAIATDPAVSADEAPAPRKRGRKRLILIGAAVLLAGGVGGGLYATGIIGGEAASAAPADDRPKLVPKAEQKRAGEDGEGHEAAAGVEKPPLKGAEKYASNYYAMDKAFTANLQDSDRFVQVGLAVSTPYDDSVVEHLKTNDIAVRSAILLTLGDTTEDQVFTAAGKAQLQQRLVKAINATLIEKEGFGGVSNVYFTNFVVQ